VDDGFITSDDVVGTGTFVFDGPSTAGSFLLIDLASGSFEAALSDGTSFGEPPPGSLAMPKPLVLLSEGATAPVSYSASSASEAVEESDFSPNAVGIQAIPEPTSIVLLGLGLIGLGFSMRRRA
jgi:hypothetical protein